MNNSELREWLNYHEAAFPGYLKWMQQAENGGDTVVRDRMALWASRVRNLDQDATRAASKHMFDTGIDLYFSKHLGYVCDYAQRMRPEPERFSHLCRLCNNTGIVSVRFHGDRKTYAGNPLPDNVGQAGRYHSACEQSETSQAHPATWLNAKRWEDEDMPPPRQSNGNGRSQGRGIMDYLDDMIAEDARNEQF